MTAITTSSLKKKPEFYESITDKQKLNIRLMIIVLNNIINYKILHMTSFLQYLFMVSSKMGDTF